ncbi:hypothetical protein CAF53_25515 (plasmid) [Sphingobium sp. LB126]|nr:hypothetical protein CAF53_25515 [Sphingobium sp. LB126]
MKLSNSHSASTLHVLQFGPALRYVNPLAAASLEASTLIKQRYEIDGIAPDALVANCDHQFLDMIL